MGLSVRTFTPPQFSPGPLSFLRPSLAPLQNIQAGRFTFDKLLVGMQMSSSEKSPTGATSKMLEGPTCCVATRCFLSICLPLSWVLADHTPPYSDTPSHKHCHTAESQPPCPFPEQDPVTTTLCPTLTNCLSWHFPTPSSHPPPPVSPSIATSLGAEVVLHSSGQEHRNRIIKQK